MSNLKGPKKENAELTGNFSIKVDEWNNEIPGVTRLLDMNAKKGRESTPSTAALPGIPKLNVPATPIVSLEPTRASIATLPSRTEKPEASTSNTPPQKLGALGVLFEMQFILKNSEYVFQDIETHHSGKVEAWQREILSGMKLNLEKLQFTDSFKEYQFKVDSFIFDVMGINPIHAIHIVQEKKGSDKVHVLVSKQSLESRKKNVLESIATATNDHSVSIELDFG